jgi:hypothetical protein
MLKKISHPGHFVLLLLLAIGLTGCASVPMPRGSSKGYSSVRFIAPNQALGEDELPAFIEANRIIKETITDQMEKNGLKVVEQSSDLIVAYLIILQDNVSTAYCNQYYGYQDFSDIVDMAHKKGMKKNYPEHVQKRALVIDLIDAKTFKLVYRNYVISGTLVNLSEEERQARISKSVSQTLHDFFQ